ncbi:MAG: SDR family NAD(P)-dependent oxidoreductase [Candidatus Izemoplasmatales bacterium]|nr:SDR family NAD(P)-dependent oxidoreductase [Candidatus Izemoplasmatales bacterium]
MNKIIFITGATNGIGLALFKALISRGDHVLAVGSNKDKCSRLETEFHNQFPDAVFKIFACDLSSQAAIQGLIIAAKEYLSSKNLDKIDCLINHAGSVMDHLQMTVDGIEYQLALNQLATIQLTESLLSYTEDGLVLFTGSTSHYKAKIHWDNLEFKKGFYRIFGSYRQSKLANVMTAKYYNYLWEGTNRRAYVIDPGLVKTNVGTKNMKGLPKLVWNIVKRRGDDPTVPIETYLYVIDNRPDGFYFRDKKAINYNKSANDLDACKKLYQISKAKIKF